MKKFRLRAYALAIGCELKRINKDEYILHDRWSKARPFVLSNGEWCKEDIITRLHWESRIVNTREGRWYG